MIGDYLFIKTANPSVVHNNKAAPGRGLGSWILSDIAVQYGGDYNTQYNDGVFTALVSLMQAKSGNMDAKFDF